MSEGWIYFVRAPAGLGRTRVKIGFTTNPHKRLKSLQIGSPIVLELMGAVRGTRADETALHRAHASDRTHGEWFIPRAWQMDLLLEHGEFLHPMFDRFQETA